MSFGVYNPLDGTLPQASATVTTTCTPGSVSMTVNGGNNATAYKHVSDQSITRCQRAMKSTRGDFVAYDIGWVAGIYNPSQPQLGNPVVAGDTCSRTYGTTFNRTFVAGSSNNATRVSTLYGYIRNFPSDKTERSASVNGSAARPGSYSDSLIVQLNY